MKETSVKRSAHVNLATNTNEHSSVSQVANALRVAMRLNDVALIKEIIDTTEDV